VLTLIGRDVQLEEAKGFLKSIDQNGARNYSGENVY
jgi:hypothetical protein